MNKLFSVVIALALLFNFSVANTMQSADLPDDSVRRSFSEDGSLAKLDVTCEVCNSLDDNDSRLEFHKRFFHNGEDIEICTICKPSSIISIREGLQRHAQRNHRKLGFLDCLFSPSCPVKGYFAKGNAVLRTHLEQYHSDNGDYQCSCGFRTYYFSTANNHRESCLELKRINRPLTKLNLIHNYTHQRLS